MNNEKNTEGMNTGVAFAIFRQINSDKYSDKQKENAIRRVLEMETTNSITKAEFKEALRWSMKFV